MADANHGVLVALWIARIFPVVGLNEADDAIARPGVAAIVHHLVAALLYERSILGACDFGFRNGKPISNGYLAKGKIPGLSIGFVRIGANRRATHGNLDHFRAVLTILKRLDGSPWSCRDTQ